MVCEQAVPENKEARSREIVFYRSKYTNHIAQRATTNYYKRVAPQQDYLLGYQHMQKPMLPILSKRTIPLIQGDLGTPKVLLKELWENPGYPISNS
jgi:hypothetical protein